MARRPSPLGTATAAGSEPGGSSRKSLSSQVPTDGRRCHGVSAAASMVSSPGSLSSQVPTEGLSCHGVLLAFAIATRARSCVATHAGTPGTQVPTDGRSCQGVAARRAFWRASAASTSARSWEQTRHCWKSCKRPDTLCKRCSGGEGSSSFNSAHAAGSGAGGEGSSRNAIRAACTASRKVSSKRTLMEM